MILIYHSKLVSKLSDVVLLLGTKIHPPQKLEKKFATRPSIKFETDFAILATHQLKEIKLIT
jgi:hypothetical protein